MKNNKRKDGLIAKAKQAKEAAEQAQLKDQNDIDTLYDKLASYNGTTSSNNTTTAIQHQSKV